MKVDKSSDGHYVDRNYNYNRQTASDYDDVELCPYSHESNSCPKRVSKKMIKQEQDHEMIPEEKQSTAERKELPTEDCKQDDRDKENHMTDSFGRHHHHHHKRALSSPRSHSHNLKIRNKNRFHNNNHGHRDHDPYAPRNSDYMDNRHYFCRDYYCQPFPPIPPPYLRERRIHYEYNCHNRYHHYPEEERDRRSYPPRYYHPSPPRNFGRCSSPPRPYRRDRAYRSLNNNNRGHWPKFRTSYRGRSRHYSQDGQEREFDSKKGDKLLNSPGEKDISK